MLFLGLDFESGGSFDEPLEKNFITEVGAVLWCSENGPVKMMNKLVYQGKQIYEDASQYTGITNEMVATYGEPLDVVLIDLLKMIAQADYIVAQNGLMFDRPLLKQELATIGLEDANPKQLWLDTTCDVPYPKNCRNTNLTYLAGFHLLLNCFPHRAVTDVLTMFSVMMKYDLNEIIKNASEPTVTVRALTNFEQKDLAKKASFYWEPKEKLWLKNLRKSKYEELAPTWPFQSVVVKEEIREGSPLLRDVTGEYV
jgi:DNA polymerase III subunit epsilon